MAPDVAARLLVPPVLDRLGTLVDLPDTAPLERFDDARAGRLLASAEVLITGWGCPVVDRRALDRAPALRAVVHTAGTVKRMLSEACWERGIQVSSAAAANALPVAEYTLAAILLANKRVLAARDAYRDRRGPYDWQRELAAHGNYRRTVGVIGASRVGRRVIELLRPFDLRVLLSDPYVSATDARALGAEPAGLDQLCARSDVVSVHAPALPETRHLLDARRLALMPDGSTLVNTARGMLVDTAALTRELLSGRLHAVLDVTDPEVLPADSPLYELPNVLLTPHIAGSMGNELSRLADFALDELERWAAGRPFAAPVLASDLARQA
jgi:phosphoglycerate dehydrogenase-like enzyme